MVTTAGVALRERNQLDLGSCRVGSVLLELCGGLLVIANGPGGLSA